MTRDEYNLAVLEAIGCEAEFENDGSPLALAIARAQAGRASGDNALADAATDTIVATVAAPFPTRVHRRDEYNAAILDEARSFYSDAMDAEAEDGDDEEFDGCDPELGAQIDTICGLTAAQASAADIDTAVDHLRGMLVIGYCDEDDLPGCVPARRAPLTGAAAVAQAADDAGLPY